jgi:NADPH:quinone reductase-like Zn-dependent oxidoreductase
MMRHLLVIPLVGWAVRAATGKKLRLVSLKPNRDLQYLNERFECGQLVPVIDGPYKLADGREAFRHFGAGRHKGKVVLTID